MSGGSTVDVASGTGSTGRTFVGATASTAPTGPLTGVVSLSGGSTLNAGSLLGMGSNGVNNDTGAGSVVLSDMSTVNATNIVIGQNGLLGGDGTINGNVTNNGGTLNPDPLYINGDYLQVGGSIDFEVVPDSMGGFKVDTVVFGLGYSVRDKRRRGQCRVRDGADPAEFEDDGLLNFDTFFRVSNPGGTGDCRCRRSSRSTAPLPTSPSRSRPLSPVRGSCSPWGFSGWPRLGIAGGLL